MKEYDEFKKSCKDSESTTICLDFDGVIHKNSKGFYDGTIYDNPLKGALDSIEELSYDFDLIIYTCKANPKRPLVKGKTGIELVWGWLKKHNVSQYIKDVTYIKPNAICYVDDKGIKFDNWDSCLITLQKLNK